MKKYWSGWLLGDISEIVIGLCVMCYASHPRNWFGLLGAYLAALGLIRLDKTLGGGSSIFDDFRAQIELLKK